MYELMNKMRGSALVKVSGASVSILLSRCASSGIELMSATPGDAYTLLLRLPYRQLPQLENLAARSMCSIQVESTAGAVRLRAVLRRRLAVFLCLLLALGAVFWSKAYIWEIQVSGNDTVTTGEILDALEQCGVETGACWLGFTSDSIRSRMLVLLPELSWMTVNIYGSRAEVIVRERIPKPEMLEEDSPADLVAARSGVITNVLALAGQEQVKEGQAVMQGETLVSGAIADIHGQTRTVHAFGEVRASTYYELTAVSPAQKAEKIYSGRERSRWALVIGDKRINFYGNSSNYDDSCDKIYSVYKLEIKGLFSLPVSLVREKSVYYETAPAAADEKLMYEQMKTVLRSRLPDGETDEVRAAAYSQTRTEDMLTVCLRAECEENIAAVVPIGEERLQEIGQNNESVIKEGNTS